MPFVSSIGLIAVWAAPADAAGTRAEYIAQFDPICQTFAGRVGDAYAAYHRNRKLELRAAKYGTVRAWLRRVRLTAGSLDRLAQIHTSMVDQIAAVPPPGADAGTVGTWLNYRRQEAGFETSAATALIRLQLGKFFKRLRQADKALDGASSAISGFGFQVCGTVN